ncbi:MAG: YitT family protein [Hydrogenibacillus sp.]|nr:YitT family protein [Hydrogenibacillus sp.]
MGIVAGTFLAALALTRLLIPFRMIDGGTVGIAIIAHHLSALPLGLWIVLLNLPFLFLGYREIGKTFVVTTLAAVVLLSGWVTVLSRFPPLVDSAFLATVFGGLILGIGVGLVIRNGGSLDGTEIVAIVLNERTDFSVGEIVMFFNIFIFTSAAFVFSLESAMYSVIAYYIAYRVIDMVLTGLEEMKSVIIISDQADDIAEAIMARLGRGVTHLAGVGGYSKEEKKILYCVVTRLEVSKLKSIVRDFDPEAFVTIENVHDVLGGRFNKRSIH